MIASNIRASFSALLISLTSALPAFAGDAAYPEAIGFSDDGTRFAFAEWGRQDGSGFAYANLYVIDLAKDAWLGAPVRVLLEDETASPRAAYRQALETVETRLQDYQINLPARQAYAAPFDNTGPNSGSVRWARYGALDGRSTAAPFVLQMREVPSSCPDPAMVFSLSWAGDIVHQDQKLPASRGCPVRYSVERIFVEDQTYQPKYAVALIGVYRQGFEGPDLRHMAIPLPLPSR